MSTIEQTQNTNGQGSTTGTTIKLEELASSPQSSNSNERTGINQDSFSFKNIHSLRFILQAAFSTIILIFCLSQLYISKDQGKNDAIYWGGVTGILALWMPSPSTSGTPPTNQPNFESAGSADKRP